MNVVRAKGKRAEMQHIFHLSNAEDGDEAEEEVKENIVKTLLVVSTMVLTTVQIARHRL